MALSDSLLGTLKTMADMNIAEKRNPQDGRIPVLFGDQNFDVRVSTAITYDGEAVVMRILDSTSLSVGLDNLGLSADHYQQISRLIRQPNGMVFVAGPTGSGKTTTAYSCLEQIAGPEQKTMTVEDPPEMQIPYVTHCPVSRSTFPALLRSFMRQDPDVIYVGETRDLATLQIAVEASLTGHLIITTLHANDAMSTIMRLIDMGIEPYLIAATVTGIVAQRLCRKICETCKEPYEVPATDLARFGFVADDPGQTVTLYRGTGCEACRNRGYRGRTGIFEILTMNEEIADLLVNRAPMSDIRDAARDSGMRELRDDGLAKVLAGITTPDEVMRVVFTAMW